MKSTTIVTSSGSSSSLIVYFTFKTKIRTDCSRLSRGTEWTTFPDTLCIPNSKCLGSTKDLLEIAPADSDKYSVRPGTFATCTSGAALLTATTAVANFVRDAMNSQLPHFASHFFKPRKSFPWLGGRRQLQRNFENPPFHKVYK